MVYDVSASAVMAWLVISEKCRFRWTDCALCDESSIVGECITIAELAVK